ncbi:Metallophosphoesterase [Pseudomonas syringae pv. maculicola str. M6]|nr:Metallophosphoesterase [Pseudomonas syringae pv. maculicola str. M6]
MSSRYLETTSITSTQTKWIPEFQRLGMRVLVNEHVILQKGADQIVVAGVTDEAAPAFGHEGPNLSRALVGAPLNTPSYFSNTARPVRLTPLLQAWGCNCPGTPTAE